MISGIRCSHSTHLVTVRYLLVRQASRSFFGRTNDNTSSDPDMNRRHYERKLIHLPQEQLYDIIADVDNYQKFVPWCINSVVTKRTDNTMRADLTVGFNVFNETYTSDIVMERPNFVTASSKDSNLFRYLRTEWKFSPANRAKSTWVSFQVDFMFKSSLYNDVSKLFLKEVTSKMVQAFEKRSMELARQNEQKRQHHSSTSQRTTSRAAIESSWRTIN